MPEPLVEHPVSVEDAVSQTTPPLPPSPGALGPVTYTIKVLSTARGAHGEALRTVLFQRTSPGESIEISAETDAPNLLAKLPDLLEAALDLQRALWPAQRTVSRLPASFFPLLAEESRLVRWLTQGGSPVTGRRELLRRRLAREAMIVRDVAWESLRAVLPGERRAEIDALVSVHETPAELVASMEAIAGLVERMLGDVEDAVVLAACDIDAEYAAALHRQAALLAAESAAAPEHPAPRRPGVLRLIGMAYRALRTEAFMTVARPGAPPRARGGGGPAGRGRRGG